MPILQQGSINTNGLSVPDIYVQIVPPQNLVLNGVPTNIAGIEKTRSFHGLYHVLHGTLSPVNGIGPEQLRLRNLWPRLAETDELILATSPTVEGEATARYLLDEIRKTPPALRITRIATGVPAGSDIEYADEVTMTRALEGRRDL